MIHTTETSSKDASMSSDDHQIAVFAVPDDPEPLERLLETLPHMDRPTVRQIILSLPGLVPCALSRSEAADAAAGIRDLGVHATSIPQSDIPDVSHAVPVHHLKLSRSSLDAIGVHDEVQSWTAEEIDLLSVGVVPSTAPEHHRPAPALSMGSSHRSWNDGSHRAAKKRPEAIVVLHDDTVLSLASDEMNYEYLGDRLSTSSGTNFASMMRDLRQLAVEAWITPSTRSFLDHAPVRHFEFHTRDDFLRYTQFQTLLRGQFGRHQ